MKTIAWIGGVALLGAAAVATLVANAAVGDPAFVRLTSEATLDSTQKSRLSTWALSIWPDAQPSQVQSLYCQREGGVRCRLQENRTVTVAEYVSLEADGVAFNPGEPSGGDVTYEHRTAWAYPSASQVSSLKSWVDDAHSEVSGEELYSLHVSRSGSDVVSQAGYHATASASAYLTLRSQGLVEVRTGTVQ